MDRIMNTHRYPSDLIEKYTHICAFNAYKKEFIEMMPDDRFGEEHERKKYLVNDYRIAPILKYTVPFLDEDGQMKRLPDYVVEEIREAIGSINLYPNPLTMKAAGENYVLSVTYIDEIESNTKVILEYTFNKNVRQFEGYFAKSIENQRWLPHYEIVQRTNGKEEMIILAIYKNNSSLRVNIECDELPEVPFFYLPDELQNYLCSTSLLDAVILRLFPTKAHIYKHVINEIIVKGESDFRNDMRLTPLNWTKLSRKDAKYNLCAKYMLTCYRTKESQPIEDNQLSDEDKNKAMKLLIKKYPFFTIDDQPKADICVLDSWFSYFKEKLTSKDDGKMELSDSVVKKIITCYSSDPEKCSKIIEQFPSVLFPIMLKDFQRRYDILKNMNHKDNAILCSEDVICFNRLKSTLPARCRLYLYGGTIDEPVYESGRDIVKKIQDNIPPANAIEKINYLDIEYEKYPLSMFKLMTIIAPLANDLEILQPEYLEKKFQSYRFSQTYKTAPTEMDSLAVRFANVYTKGYNVPEIPDDFFDRLNNLEEPKKDDESELNCVMCNESIKSHMFPMCKHVCVCELCSYSLLECPICRQEGNPQKVFL